MTAADVQRLAARYIQSDKMAVVVVGDRRTIEGPIRQLNLGPVNIIPIDELFRLGGRALTRASAGRCRSERMSSEPDAPL